MRLAFTLSGIVVCLICSCNDNNYQQKRIGNNIVEAHFINDSLIDGEAKFYDLAGNLEAKGQYMKGIKMGYWVSYYRDGKIKDSLNYSDNLLNGEAYRYDRNGVILFKATNFYGVSFGDHSFFSQGKIQEYYFDGFEKNQLVNSKYDSLGRCEALVFNVKPLINESLVEKRKPVINFFIYFPHPPGFDIKYTLGIIDSVTVTLNSDRLFLDTTLNKPKQGLNYFLSVDYKNLENDSTVNVFYRKF